ncbi:hypothetical protein I3843_04G074400 [Carya illinoinensis]|nr:hypothetical protein I3843_04G074400 [Carya illinoinensis]
MIFCGALVQLQQSGRPGREHGSEMICSTDLCGDYTRSVTSDDEDDHVCSICLTNPKNLAFGCGRPTCKDCGVNLSLCPMCREPITTRLRLFT